MALFQIAEPGESAAPHEHRLAVGIDLGTTNSLVASVISASTEVIADEKGRKLLPSVVRYLADGSVVTGADALAAAESDPANTISSAKRLIGRRLADIEHAEHLPYEIEDAEGMLRIRTAAGPKTPVEVSAEILKTLRDRAEARFGGEPLTGAVITVPAYFDDAQRQATKDAARLANLTVLRLLNEPTAAALAYGLDNGAEGLYLIYDLGGGTFDVSLLKLTKGVFEVLATGGDSALGGDDFDHRVFCWALEEVRKEFGSIGILSQEEKRRLLNAARAAKEALTDHEEAPLTVTLADGKTTTLTLTRKTFEDLTCHLVRKTIDAVGRVLHDADVKTDDIRGIVLVGGATRMPVISQCVERAFGLKPLSDIDPDQVVTPLSLGLETMGGLVEKVIPRNSPIPIARAQDFTTFRDGQTAMAIHVVQGEREVVDACRSLARFELRGIPPMAAGAARIRVTFEVDADGLLSVSAREQETGVEASVTVKPSYGLSDEEIVRMLRDGTGSAAADMAARELREQQVEARRLLESIHGALKADGDLLSAEERAHIDGLVETLSGLVTSDDADAIRNAIETLSKETESFAARRMNRSILAALAGHSVDDFASEGKE